MTPFDSYAPARRRTLAQGCSLVLRECTMRTREQEVEPLINLSEITEIELLILKRMREFTIGEHSSMFHGTGFDFVGLRDWQAGDRFEHIDWAQSSLNNFSPLIVREFEQPTTSGVILVADRSASTRCGADTAAGERRGMQIATLIARAIATIGMSAVFFQDSIGLITFDEGFAHLGAVRPRIGKGQVIHCVEAYQSGHGLQEIRHTGSLSATLIGFSRKTSMMPVISDFLFDDADGVPARAVAGQQRARRVHHDGRCLVCVRAAARVGGLDRGLRRRDRPDADDVAARAQPAERARPRVAG